ncbi:MAG TPA: Gfo/Idh/MocA family oxidoreductase [Acidimicrobiales bacterium]|nr:Gfo/Idh/MocA family oxidoreductase [Acidimicrobiales bacterium]
MTEPLRLGVVGVGAISLRGLLPHLTQEDVLDKVNVRALCDPVEDRVRAAAAEYDVPHVYVGIADLLAGAEIDAVTIASPIGFHYEHCRLALEAGKHVHVNKTLCTTVAEADELIDLARARDLRIVASPGEILRPQLRRTRELIDEGAVGELAWVICGGAFESYHEQDEPERLDPPGGQAINPAWYFKKPGGGPMYDITVYSLHQLTSVLGPAKRVTAMSGIRIAEREFLGARIATEADDNTVLLVDFGQNRFAVVHGTAAGAISEQFGAGVYFGTRGTIDGVLLNGEPFDFPGREETLGAPVTDWEAQMRVLPHVVGAHRSIPESHVFEDVMQLVESVASDRSSAVSAEHARHVIEIIESGYRAAETGATQELATTFELAGSTPT